MFIKSVVLDGFKSYGQRTEITGFDDMFNAITGLNGSGKSNILDAICFVLGISNLSHVRAGSLQDLIYKCGQAGVNKATVSITFDNKNRAQCPPGFENFPEITISRQVVMGGKNKYMINGTIVPNKKVHDLFCSVQLNVNNPHFLIMQGKITKVLNMKAPEILSMVEEAAGTRMYETKKCGVQKTIEKKDAKLKDIKSLLDEEVVPKLDKLKREREKYLEYLQVERQLDHMLGQFQAWQYFASQRAAKNAQQLLDSARTRNEEIENNIKTNKTTIKEIDNEIEIITKKADSEANERLEKIEAELRAKEKIEAKINSSIKSIKDNIISEEKKKTTLEKNLIEDEKVLKTKENELGKVKNLFEELKENDTNDNQAFLAAEKRYEALSAGMEMNEKGEAETLQEQLMNVKQDATQAGTEAKQATMQLNFCRNQLKEKETNLSSYSDEYERDKTILEKLEKETDQLGKKLENINYSEGKMNDLQQRRHKLNQEIRYLKERIECFEDQIPYSKFSYRDPETNFDRRSVYGIICRLIKVKDVDANRAIETAAGGRLYNVAVDTDVTGKKLLQRGNLQQRTTFIPLNKIVARKMDNNVIRIAQELVGKENVQPALAHLEYDKRLQIVMDFIFGNVFICKDINVARQVAFHEKIKKRCVTLDGDVADPAGTLSGGAPQKGASILAQLREILAYEDELRGKEDEIHNIESEIHQMIPYQEKYTSMKQNLELKQHELNLLKQKLQQTTHYRQRQEVNDLKNQIEQLNEKIATCEKTERQCGQIVKELEMKMKNFNREDQLKNVEKEMKQLKQKAEKSRKQWQQHEQEYETLNLEISELKKGLDMTKQQIDNCRKTIMELNEKCTETTKHFEELGEEIREIQTAYKTERSLIAENNKEIQKKIKEKERLLAAITEFELEIKKNNHEIKKLQDDCKKSKSREEDLTKKMKDNRYLEDGRKLSDEDGVDLERRIRTSQETKNKLARTVNSKAQKMIEQEEKVFSDLCKRYKIVENDRKKLITTLTNLDKRKENVLKLAYEQISKDFGSIFGTLLPGANAKLIAPTGKTILQGLEIKVSLGNVWKESLTELSGGQRSLAALSLILAMLLFKPAPLYILDEVDAALDLSHTQNIGNMLKTHFKKSQFIIVSLKDGMFNNANVLYRTKFIDGVSTVTRTVNRNVALS